MGTPARRATATRSTADGRRGNRRRASRPDRAQELSTSPLLRTAQVGAATARPMADLLLINRIGASADGWSASCPRPGPAEISPPGPPFAWRATRRRIDRPARARSPLRSSRKQKLTRRRPGRRFRRQRRATCPVLIITLARRSGLETAGPAGVEVRRVLYMASPHVAVFFSDPDPAGRARAAHVAGSLRDHHRPPVVSSSSPARSLRG